MATHFYKQWHYLFTVMVERVMFIGTDTALSMSARLCFFPSPKHVSPLFCPPRPVLPASCISSLCRGEREGRGGESRQDFQESSSPHAENRLTRAVTAVQRRNKEQERRAGDKAHILWLFLMLLVRKKVLALE